MESKDTSNKEADSTSSSQIVTTESDQAKEAPAISLEAQQTVSGLQPEISVHFVASTPSIMQPVPLVAQPLENERSLREWFSIWWDGIRPAYLPLSFLPVSRGGFFLQTHRA